MFNFQPGTKVKVKYSGEAEIIRKIGEGGQGSVYEVNFAGKKKALKWYAIKNITDPKRFYDNLENNIKKGKPTRSFLWPEAITERMNGSFGYIMDLRPAEYKDFTHLLLGKWKFENLTAWVNATIYITASFRELHINGFSYQDLNDGSFFINPKTGKVLICDNDNVSEQGSNSGIIGKPGYMAPEILAKNAMPGILTDNFSLSVVLYMLWTNNHPLEGKSTCPAFMGAANEKKMFGENPVFVWDPIDKSNRPVRGIHEGSIRRWPFLPLYLQEKFIKAFSKELLHNPNARINDLEWLQLFIRLRAEIYKCGCGEVYFADQVAKNPCPKCFATNVFELMIRTPRYNLPVHQKTKLFTCHLDRTSDDFETQCGEISVQGNKFYLKNTSIATWYSSDGDTVQSGESLVLRKGLSFDVANTKIDVI